MNSTMFAVIFITGLLNFKQTSIETIRLEIIRATDSDTLSKPIPPATPSVKIETGTTDPSEVLSFAKTLIGIPYLYASTDPSKGFDCSGFVTYVFNHFSISMPRSSVDFTHVGKDIDYRDARAGDLILFTGTDSTNRVVGHMGIVEGNENSVLHFIHSSSGKAKGVVITAFEKYYKSRFIKVIRIFPERFFE